ncbi:MAG TPA: tetratricopeptide repeat protein, partial [Pyrinomonadaceae bacterium]|nr:tetratricopeptide repeat protein [Pyrinomonadaceae bacterium]
MKRCPECRRNYFDNSLVYCLDDGSVLVDGPSMDAEPPTAIFHDTSPSSEKPTKVQGHVTDQTAVLPPASFEIRPRRRSAVQIATVAALVVTLTAIGVIAYRAFRPANSGTINSIAVLPFENRSGSTDADYLSDGLTDSLIFRFSQLPNLKVSPTSSVMHYKGGASDVAQIARELDVDAVLSGRLSQIGDSLNISVQLIDARTKKLIWAEQYDRKMADLLATQREIATTITQKLQLNLKGDEKGIAKKYTSSSEAYQLYMKGRFHWAKRDKDDMFKAVDSYKQAIALDPNFALAYAALAEVYNSMAKDPDIAPKDAVPFAKTAATRALELDPSLPEAHSAFGDSLAIYDWNWTESEREFKRAIELDPNISYIHLAYSGSYLGYVGKTDEAVTEAEKAVELEPLSLINNSVLASSYVYARRYDKALTQAQKAFELDTNFPLARQWVGIAYILNGQYQRAIDIAQQTPPDSPSRWTSLMVIAHAYAKMGDRTNCERVIGELEEVGKTRYIRRYYIASIYATL